MKTEVVVLHLKWITEEIAEIVHMVTVKRGNLELVMETEDKRYSETVASAGNVPSSDLIHQNGSYFSVLSVMFEGAKCFIRNLEGEKS